MMESPCRPPGAERERVQIMETERVKNVVGKFSPMGSRQGAERRENVAAKTLV
jgi:hypothetical protein